MEILSLGEKIKRKRKELDMTLKDLAGDRITPGQISLVESGKSNPSMDLLEYLALTLNTSVEYLMESEETQAEKICLYFEDMAEFNIMNENLNAGEEYIEKALVYAEKYNLEYRKARNLFLRGSICISKNEMALAQQFFLSANGIFIRENKYEEVVNTFLKLGCITLEMKAYHSAFSYFQQAEKVYTNNDIGNDLLLGQIYYYIAYSNFKLDNVDKAINYSYLSKEKFSQLDNKKEYAKSLLLIAEEYSKQGNVDKAIKYSKKTLQAFKDVNDSEYLSKVENDIGKLFFEFQNIEESFIHYKKAKELREKNNDKKLIETLINICENYIKLKEVQNSKNLLNEIMENIDEGDADNLLSYYLLKYRINNLENNYNEAENTLIMALDYSKGIGNIIKAAEISIILGKFYIDNGDDKKAAIYLNMGVELFKEQGILK
ncbi:MAG: helix-turn-helix transcriptional regulator [Clostridiaceae bacterium]|nr:helix-turn-helix transcriptional regulator [Clostridiaceae bacterium]